MKRPWLSSEIALLDAMLVEGCPLAEIVAKSNGRTYSAVRHACRLRRRALGLAPQSNPLFNSQEAAQARRQDDSAARSSEMLVAATMAAFARVAEREGVSIEIAGLRCLYGREAAAKYERAAA